MTITGSDNGVLLRNWFGRESAQIHQFKVGGSTLLNNQVDQLVSAMAAYYVPSGAGNIIPQETKDALQPVLASSWT